MSKTFNARTLHADGTAMRRVWPLSRASRYFFPLCVFALLLMQALTGVVHADVGEDIRALPFLLDPRPKASPGRSELADVTSRYPHAITRKIEDKRYEIVETGLEVMTQSFMGQSISWWLSNDLVVVSALQDVPNAKRNKWQRVLLVDARTGQSKTLVPEGRMICWNSDRLIAGFTPTNYRYEMVDGPRWHARLDNHGNYERLSEPESLDKWCRPTGAAWPKVWGHSAAEPLREADGYIYMFQRGEPAQLTAKLIRQNAPPKDIGIVRQEIDTPLYLPYLDKYLLNNIDSQGSSDTDKLLAGSDWNRPYDLTPYRLMSPDGDIEEIPYPKIIFEFGLKGFSYLWPTPHGLLINATGKHGLLLINGERLTRIWGGQDWFAPGHGESVPFLSIAPDGCRIAFAHSSRWTWDSSNPFTIMNLCKEQ